MRISVRGDCPAAKVLRGYIRANDCGYLTDSRFDYRVHLRVDDSIDTVLIDSIDCALERKVLTMIQDLGVQRFILQRIGAIKSDREISIVYPSKYQAEVELGLYRALSSTFGRRRERVQSKVASYAIPALIGFAIFLIAALSHGAEMPLYFTHQLPKPVLFQVNFPIIRVFGTDGSTVLVGDSVNQAVRVNMVAGGSGGGTVVQGAGAGAATNYWNSRITDGTNFIPFPTALAGAGGLKVECLSGCGGAAAFADASAFTFGTTSIGNIGAVVDDVGTNTVAENSAGTPRMGGNRILYTNIRDTSGAAFGVPGNELNVIVASVDTPVDVNAQPGVDIGDVTVNNAAGASAVNVQDGGNSLTVDGVFFQATQPISAAALPLPAGAATSALQTQPGVDIGDVTINNAAGAAAVNIQDGGNSITVDGTVAISTALLLDATYTGRMPAGASPADNESNTITALSRIGNFNFVFDGATWDRAPGNSASGAKVFFSQTTTDNDVDVLSVIPGTAATNLGKAEDAAHTTGDTGNFILAVRADPTTTALTTANTEYTQISADYVGALYEGAHPGRFSCFVPLTATVMTQCQAAPAAGLRAYVTSMQASNGAATVQGMDIVYGTGANCATAPTALTHKYQMGTNALTTSPFEITAVYSENTPLVPAAANAICCRPTAATAFGCTITGFIAP